VSYLRFEKTILFIIRFLDFELTLSIKIKSSVYMSKNKKEETQ